MIHFFVGVDVGLIVGAAFLIGYQLRLRNHQIAKVREQIDQYLADEWEDGDRQAFEMEVGKWCKPAKIRRALEQSGALFTEEARSGGVWFVGSLDYEQMQRFRDAWAQETRR